MTCDTSVCVQTCVEEDNGVIFTGETHERTGLVITFKGKRIDSSVITLERVDRFEVDNVDNTEDSIKTSVSNEDWLVYGFPLN